MLFSLGIIFLASCSKPEAAFVAQYANGEENPDHISFTNKSINCEAYTWNFGDGSVSNEESPSHKFKSFGNVMVVLEGKSGTSVDRDTQYVNIPEPPRVKVKIETSFGDITAELFNSTPLHRDNFIKMANEKYFDGLLFHRVMNEFMIQGGDPNSRDAPPDMQLGMGGPGYTVPQEYGEFHFRGRLAGARRPDQAASNGSQFYIVHGQRFSSIELMNYAAKSGAVYSEEDKKRYAEEGGYAPLDMQYTVFGQVLEGMDVVDKIALVDVNGANRPLEDVKMKVSVINE